MFKKSAKFNLSYENNWNEFFFVIDFIYKTAAFVFFISSVGPDTIHTKPRNEQWKLKLAIIFHRKTDLLSIFHFNIICWKLRHSPKIVYNFFLEPANFWICVVFFLSALHYYYFIFLFSIFGTRLRKYHWNAVVIILVIYCVVLCCVRVSYHSFIGRKVFRLL